MRLHANAIWIGLLITSASLAAQTTVTTTGGTTNYVPIFNGSATLTNSMAYQDGSGDYIVQPATGNAGLNVYGGTSGQASVNIADGHGTGYTMQLLTNQVQSFIHTNTSLTFTLPSGGYYFDTNTYGTLLSILYGGNVGIGTASPSFRLDVAGQIHSSSGVVYADGTTQTTAWTGALCGGDYAESVDVTGDRRHYEPGDVLVIDPDTPGKFLKSAESYSTSVTGIYSTKPGVLGRRQTTPKTADEVPMAMIGIVPTKVSAENGAIHPGDLLVTSSTLGYAMKGTDRSRMLGAVIGKALGRLDSGKGVIEVVVTLQ